MMIKFVEEIKNESLPIQKKLEEHYCRKSALEETVKKCRDEIVKLQDKYLDNLDDKCLDKIKIATQKINEAKQEIEVVDNTIEILKPEKVHISNKTITGELTIALNAGSIKSQLDKITDAKEKYLEAVRELHTLACNTEETFREIGTILSLLDADNIETINTFIDSNRSIVTPNLIYDGGYYITKEELTRQFSKALTVYSTAFKFLG